MGYEGTLRRLGGQHELSLGLWLGLSALLLIAVLVPPLLLPLLLVLTLRPLLGAIRRPWTRRPARAAQGLRQPDSARGPPRS